MAEIKAFLGEGEILGTPSFLCRSVSSIAQATGDQLSFIKDRRYFAKAETTAAGALLVPEPMEGFTGNQLVVANSQQAFGRLLGKIAAEKRELPPGIGSGASVPPQAVVGEDVVIGAGAVVREGAVRGDRSILYPRSYVGQRSMIGTYQPSESSE